MSSLSNNNNINGDFFVKKIDGECADGVYHVKIDGGVIKYKDKPIEFSSFFEKNQRYLLQEAISDQHRDLKALHATSINTIRLVTVYDVNSNDVVVLGCLLRVGINNMNVDNWAVGGLLIGVDTEKCTLKRYGFYKPSFGTKVEQHPNSHIVFDGYIIPYLKEAIDQAKEFHRRLYGIHSIGWDIGITDNGPVFIEGNDNWEISMLQVGNHGLKKEFDRLFY